MWLTKENKSLFTPVCVCVNFFFLIKHDLLVKKGLQKAINVALQCLAIFHKLEWACIIAMTMVSSRVKLYTSNCQL